MALSTRQREALWTREAEKAHEAGRGEHPICVLCDCPIAPGQLWHASHEAHKPKWLGGKIEGCSHERCNRIHNNQFDTPQFAKSERVRKRHYDFTRPRTPMRGGRADSIKKKMNGEVIDRRTGKPPAWMKPRT